MKIKLVMGELIAIEAEEMHFQYFGEFFKFINRFSQLDVSVDRSGKIRTSVAAKLFICLCWLINLPFRFLRVSGKRRVIYWKDQKITLSRGKISHEKNGNVIFRSKFSGNCPLEVDFDDSAGIVYFGEYVTKQKVAAVSVWSYELERTRLEEVVQISGVRHVHFVKIQPETKTLVLGTGDNDEESKLICVSLEKRKMRTIAEGSQLYRAVSIAFGEGGFTYGTDDPNGENFLLQCNNFQRPEIISSLKENGIDAPVYFSAQTSIGFLFSTAFENSNHLISGSKAVGVYHAEKNGKIQPLVVLKKDLISTNFGQYAFARFVAPSKQQVAISCHSVYLAGCTLLFDFGEYSR